MVFVFFIYDVIGWDFVIKVLCEGSYSWCFRVIGSVNKEINFILGKILIVINDIDYLGKLFIKFFMYLYILLSRDF